MNQAITGRLSPIAVSLGVMVSALFIGAAAQSSMAAERPTYSGQATVVRATVLGITTVLSDTGPVPPEGGAREASLLEASLEGLLQVEVLHAATVGQGNQSRSEASAANLDLTLGGNSIGAGFLMARAAVACQGSQPSLNGGSEIVGLVINGQSIPPTGDPNQTVNLPNGKVVINEQFSRLDGNYGELTVNALHIVASGLADIVISSAYADIRCAPPPPCNEFVTGGGWVTGTPSGAKANLGVTGGVKHSDLWGHLTYIDHGARMKAKGTGVTEYAVLDQVTRRIRGTAEINGQAGTYEATVADRGEPGRSDTFALSLSNGYTASGTLAGGNIQLHTCK